MKISLNQDWLFHLGDEKDSDFMGWDDRAWEKVTLPHDWAVHYPFDRRHSSGTGYLPGGTAWYRKHFVLTEEEAAQPTRLLFEGVYKHARVWINSYYLGNHAYGYTSFSYDVTPYLRAGENVIAVRVEHEDVAESRWFTGSGIDRNVYLLCQPQPGFVEGSIFVRTEKVEGTEATVLVDYATEAKQGKVTARIEDTVLEGDAGEGTLTFKVPNARLWSPDAPELYTLTMTVDDGSGRAAAEETVSFGIRTFRFDPDHGFFLNGESMKLRGVCVHHDAGVLGAAVPKNVWKKRLEKFKQSGCNAIRTAHNPPDPDLLDLCDSMGFLVMDEAFDEWEGTKNKWWQGHNVYPPKHFGYAEDFPEWHRADLESMVLRDRNHPSIILWSIGNEIDYPNDPYVTPLFQEVLGNNDKGKPAAERRYDNRKPDASRLPVIARELVGIVHALDTTRPVTSALSFPELSNRTGLADELDLSGYNYREHFYADDHKTYPDRVLLGSENSHDPKAWYAVLDNEFISGQFLWTGVDFLGECHGWPLRISQAGMLNLAGLEKPLFAQRRSLWTTEPYVRVAAGSGESERHGIWNEHFAWVGEAGEKKIVSVMTNQGEAELFLNGESLGRHVLEKEDGCRTSWEVPFAPGELRVQAGAVADCLVTPEAGAELTVQADADAYRAGDVAILEYTLKDARGILCAGREEIVRVQLLGDAELLGLENGKPDDLTPYTSDARETLDGKLVAYVRLTGKGEVTVAATTSGGVRSLAILKVE
ncbi:MAG: DUF4982 domain-containing protein [Clostridia bacterium]|nr:DUF4982 domain-containing protein [Clostridia bacterium]